MFPIFVAEKEISYKGFPLPSGLKNNIFVSITKIPD